MSPPTFRLLANDDRLLLNRVIAEDPDHHNWLLPEFFFHPTSMTTVVSDTIGPVCFVRQQPQGKTLALFIQFAHVDRVRTLSALYEGFPVVRENARAAKFDRLVFDSTSRPLVRLLQKRFGFAAIPDRPNHYALSL